MNRSCLYCTARFEVTWQRKDFCSDRCKARYIREKAPECFFCGQLIIPASEAIMQTITDKGDLAYVGAKEIGICQECHKALGTKPDIRLSDRCRTIIKKIVRSHQLDKPIPEWDDQEMEELGPTLRSHVRSTILKRQEASDRVQRLEMRLYRLGSNQF